VTRYSSRLAWEARPNRIASLLAAKREQGAHILDLTESNPTRAGLQYPSEQIIHAFAHLGMLTYEPQPAGDTRLREAIAARHDVTADRILLTASTSEAYSYLFKLLADPGDEVLAPRPSYPLFDFLAALESVRVVQYPLVYDGEWSIDFDALESCRTPRTRALIVVHPNNPTGSFLKRREAARIEEWCAENDLPIISDEVFASYGFGIDVRRVPTLAGLEHALVFALHGLSKFAGLPQMKLGWIVLGGPPESRNEALARLEWIADTFLSVGAPVQCAAPALVAAGEEVQRQIAQRASENLAHIRAAAAGSPYEVLKCEGGWYAVLRAPRTRSEEEWCLELLADDDVLVQPGFFYDFESEAYLILSLLTPTDVFREGVRRVLVRAF
jgi:aspartate/methionine/tyrosine aminotransferase